MIKKSTIAAAAAALMLGAVSIAQAGDNNSGDYSGGSRIGPLGQVFGSPRGAAFGFAYAPGWHRNWDRDRDFAYAPGHRRIWRNAY